MLRRRRPFLSSHVSPVATVSLTGRRLYGNLFGALEEGTVPPRRQSRIHPVRLDARFFCDRPRRGFGCRPCFLPFSFSLLISIRMSRPFSRSHQPGVGITQQQHNTPYPDNRPRTQPRTGPSIWLPPCHLRRQLLHHYVFVR